MAAPFKQQQPKRYKVFTRKMKRLRNKAASKSVTLLSLLLLPVVMIGCGDDETEEPLEENNRTDGDYRIPAQEWFQSTNNFTGIVYDCMFLYDGHNGYQGGPAVWCVQHEES